MFQSTCTLTVCCIIMFVTTGHWVTRCMQLVLVATFYVSWADFTLASLWWGWMSWWVSADDEEAITCNDIGELHVHFNYHHVTSTVWYSDRLSPDLDLEECITHLQWKLIHVHVARLIAWWQWRWIRPYCTCVCPKIGDCLFKAQARARDTLLCGWARPVCVLIDWVWEICLLRVSAVNLHVSTCRTWPVLFSSNDCYTTDNGVTMTTGCQKPAIASLRTWKMCGRRPLCSNVTMKIISQLLHSGHCRDPSRY